MASGPAAGFSWNGSLEQHAGQHALAINNAVSALNRAAQQRCARSNLRAERQLIATAGTTGHLDSRQLYQPGVLRSRGESDAGRPHLPPWPHNTALSDNRKAHYINSYA
eukprot:GHRQ01024489.1.p2 GENE.GHRQ01024489.1~~GHRQ01024489.1.p2  ORF type:complete len:109 (-),score=6.36 GHRQ01024489.1:63-389(-)